MDAGYHGGQDAEGEGGLGGGGGLYRCCWVRRWREMEWAPEPQADGCTYSGATEPCRNGAARRAWNFCRCGWQGCPAGRVGDARGAPRRRCNVALLRALVACWRCWRMCLMIRKFRGSCVYSKSSLFDMTPPVFPKPLAYPFQAAVVVVRFRLRQSGRASPRKGRGRLERAAV